MILTSHVPPYCLPMSHRVRHWPLIMYAVLAFTLALTVSKKQTIFNGEF